jgi:hypothetical protein
VTKESATGCFFRESEAKSEEFKQSIFDTKPGVSRSRYSVAHRGLGLLLAPHVDHLFDKGLISFSNSGDLLISPRLERQILNAWGIAQNLNVGNFSDEQSFFLEHHRTQVFKK